MPALTTEEAVCFLDYLVNDGRAQFDSVNKEVARNVVAHLNAFDGGPVQPRTIGLDQSVQMTKQLVWDLDQLVQHLDRLFGLLVKTVYRV